MAVQIKSHRNRSYAIYFSAYGAGMADLPPRLSDLLCFAIYSANGAFNRAYKPILDGLGLTYPQYVVMVALWEKDDVTVGSLGERVFLESNTLTPLLKRLEAAGLLERARDPKDERQVRIRLTDAGRALQARAADAPRRIAETLDCGEAEERIRALAAEIARLRDVLEKNAA